LAFVVDPIAHVPMSLLLHRGFNEWYDRTGEQEKRIQLAYHQSDAVVTLDIDVDAAGIPKFPCHTYTPAYEFNPAITNPTVTRPRHPQPATPKQLRDVPFLYGSRQEMWQYRHQSYVWVLPLFDQAVLETPYRMSGLIFDLKSKQLERGCPRCRLDYWMQWSRLREALTQWTGGKWPVLVVFV
jgi:hypothetical protein